MKKQRKRVLSLLIALSMLLGILPVQSVEVSAASEEPLVSILTFSDYQKWTSTWTDDWATLQTQLTDLVDGAYNAGVRPDQMIFGGDFSCLNSADTSGEGMSQVKAIVRNKWSNLTDENMVLVQGNHDPADTVGLAVTGPVEFDDYIVYVINEDDYPSKQGESSVKTIVEKTANDLKTWLDDKIEAGETRPIFIATHTGLHYDIDRTDGNNQYAYVLFDVINEAAKKLDLIYLFGHNHTNGDELVGGSLTCYTKGDKLGVCTETSIANRSGTNTVLNFTYMNYGYVGYIGDIYNNPSEDPTNTLAVSEWLIYNDRIEVSRYNADGLIDKYSVTLKKDHADVLTYGNEYTVSYNSNGGTEIDSFKTIQSWNTVSRVTPVKADAQFKCWSTNADGTGNCYQPGDSIYVEKDTVLYAQYKIAETTEDVATYHLTDTLTPGKEYLMIWNSEFYTNDGTKYALTDGTSNVTTVDASWISDDGNTIQLPLTSDLAALRWDCIYNTGVNLCQGYMIQNIGTKNYLKRDSSALTFGSIPTDTESAKSCFWKYGDAVSGTDPEDNTAYTVTPLISFNDTTKFIRYSVGGKQLKFGSTISKTDPRNSNVYLYEREATTESKWEKVDALESNGEYLIVSGNAVGNAKAMTVTGRTIGEKEVLIKEDEDGKLYIDYTAPYNDVAVVHSYQIRANEFWLDTWNDVESGEVIYLKPSEGKIKITSNHFDGNYYERFNYANGVLTGYKGTSGTDTSSTLVYNNGFTIGTESNVSLFKRVALSAGEDVHQHVFGEYTSDNNATCLVDGTQSAVCACGVVDTQPLKGSKLDHNYILDETVTPDTTHHTLKCTLCGTQKEELHYGGTATAEENAKCIVCGVEYSEYIDKDALQKAIDKAVPETDEAKYTEESWSAYKAALDAANAVLADDDATQDEVDNATNALKEAQLALVVKPRDIPEVLADFNFDAAPAEGEAFDGVNAQATGTYELVDHGTGKALKLNGINQFLSVTAKDGSSLLTEVKEFTVSFQMNPGQSKTNWGFFAAPNVNQQTYRSEKYLGIFDDNGTVKAERYNSNRMDRPVSPTYAAGENKWSHITVVYAETETILYVNGVEAGREDSIVSIPDLLGNNSILYIGKSTWESGEYMTGLIDNYKIVSRVMTAEEIAAEAAKYVDKEALQAAIDATSTVGKEEEYTPSTWAKYAVALEEANKVMKAEDAVQADIDAAATALTSAQKVLKKVADKTALDTAIKAAIPADKKDNYTEDSWAAYEKALEAAQTVLADAEATQTKVDSATKAVTDAQNALTPAVESITVTAPTKTEYVAGEDLDLAGMKVVVTYVDGTEEEITDGYEVTGYDRDKVGEQTITVTYGKEATFTVTVKAAELPYVDVNSGDWFYDAVYYNYFAGTMTGLNDDHFGPTQSLARAQFAVILYRMNDTPEVDYEAIFPDVEDDVWYKDAILWAADTGVVTGYTDTGKFGPADLINREQMAVMMYRYANYKGYTSDEPEDISGYADAGKVSAFAKEAMEWAVGNGIISGKNEGTILDPQGNATRAECATIIMRFIEKFEK